MVRKYLFIIITMFGFGIWSCADHITESREVDGFVVPANIQNIFNQSCTDSQCHGGSVNPDLRPDASFGNIVGVPSEQKPDLNRIEPDDPNKSYLYLKITGDNSIIGSRMPNGRPPLSAADIETIRLWIENGAPGE